MRAGVFGRETHAVLRAVAEGLEALGTVPVWQRPAVWTRHQAQDFDLVVTLGTRLHSGRIRDLYAERGVPVLVVDLPPIRRTGLWALWPGYVNALPATGSMDRLGLVEFQRRQLGDGVLVCGQKADDAAHGMSLGDIRSWFGRTLHMTRQKLPEKRIVWRPHPQQPLTFDGFEMSEHETLSEALSGVDALVTYNSTSGIDALLEGVPVYCNHSAYYADVASGTGLPGVTNTPAPVEDLERFFGRLTQCVWTEAELATATPYRETLRRCPGGESVLSAECSA